MWEGAEKLLTGWAHSSMTQTPGVILVLAGKQSLVSTSCGITQATEHGEGTPSERVLAAPHGCLSAGWGANAVDAQRGYERTEALPSKALAPQSKAAGSLPGKARFPPSRRLHAAQLP